MKRSRHAEDASAPADLAFPPDIGSGQCSALFLDFDGTLVDIAPSPDAVRLAVDLPHLLGALASRLDGRLALITGRSLDDLGRHLGPLDVAMAGSHGGEFRSHAGAAVEWCAEALPDKVSAGVHAIARTLGGLLVEQKPFGAAIHYRLQPEAEGEVLARAQALADAEGLALKRGKMVAELVMPGSDKGSAVRRFMGLPAFAGSTPLFAGDDVTDEDAFTEALEHGGAGVLVGPPRATRALYRLGDVAAVHDWLKAGLE